MIEWNTLEQAVTWTNEADKQQINQDQTWLINLIICSWFETSPFTISLVS